MESIIEILELEDDKGESIYGKWLNGLRDTRAQAKIISQVDRMELGNFGDSEPVGEGVSELRIHYGKGYRVYYSREGNTTYLLLCGGTKATQKKDIKQAKKYWSDYKNIDSSKNSSDW